MREFKVRVDVVVCVFTLYHHLQVRQTAAVIHQRGVICKASRRPDEHREGRGVRRPRFTSEIIAWHYFGQNTMHGLNRTHFPINAIVADALAECAEAGLLEELRAALNPGRDCPHGDALQAVRDLVNELAGASNHDLAVDVSHFFAFMELRLLNELPTQARRICRLTFVRDAAREWLRRNESESGSLCGP